MMGIEDRITVSFEDMMKNLEQNLDQLQRFQMDSTYRYALGETFVRHLSEWTRQIRDRKQDPFTVVVAGEFKRGKSSLINAILGEKVLPTNVAPETVTLNTLSYGIHKNEAVLSGGRRLALSDEELKRKSLKKLEEEVGEPIYRLELKRQNEVLKDIRIIDTPGMNDALNRFEDMVAEALAQADAVIYVYSVQNPLSRSERMYLRYSVLPQQHTKVFLVGNFADTIPDDEFDEMRDHLKERSDDLLSGEKSYLVSALDELCRIQGGERPSEELSGVLESGFADFRKDMEEMIQEKKKIITLDRMQRMCSLMKKNLSQDLDNLENGLGMDASKVQEKRESLQLLEKQRTEKLEHARAELKEEISKMKLESGSWIARIVDEMETEDLSVYSVQDLLQYYTYYCVELVQSAVQESLQYHRECILEKLHGISEELSKSFSSGAEKTNYLDFAFHLDNNTWTKGDSVTLAISQVSGNSLINLVSDFAGSMLRTSEVEADQKNVLKKIDEQFPHLRESVAKNMELQYARLEGSAGRLLEEYYGGQIIEAEETLKIFEAASLKNSEEQADIRKAVSEVREILEKM